MLREEIRAIAVQLKSRAAYYRAIYVDPRTPRGAKILLWLAIGYTLLPFDLIPDFIPVIGHLDDVVIVPALLYFALQLVPAEVKQAHVGLLQAAS